MFSPDDKRIVWPLKMESYHRQVVIRDAKNRELVIVSEWRPSLESFKAKHEWAIKFVELCNREHEEKALVPIETINEMVNAPVEPVVVPIDPEGEKVISNGDGVVVQVKKRGRPFGSKNR